jgi:CRP-like cAMP-binding protein
MDPARIDALLDTAMFGAVSEDVAVFVFERAAHREVGAGEFFFRQGERGGAAFLLQSGRVRVIRAWGGQEHLLRHLGSGDCFGEVALLDFGPRSASVVADEPCTALEITASVLRRIAEIDPMQFTLIYMNLGRELGRRLRDADERLFRSRIESVSGGVAEGYSFAVL